MGRGKEKEKRTRKEMKGCCSFPTEVGIPHCKDCKARGLQQTFSTVRAEIIAELILEGVGPIIYSTFLLELIAFRLIPLGSPKKALKITGNDN